MTSWGDVLSAGISAVAALGGVGVVAAGVAKVVSDHTSQKWLQANQGRLDQALETHRAELAKETETHKLTLKRQELIFQRELEAADAFMSFWRIVYPRYRHPDMDWNDACEDAAHSLGQIEKVVEEYLERHSVAISPDVRDWIERARLDAATEKFFESNPNKRPPQSAVDAAGRILDVLIEARDQILKDLRR